MVEEDEVDPNLANRQQDGWDDLNNARWFAIYVTIVGFVALLVWAATFKSDCLVAFAVGGLILSSAALAGGLLGLLFGIPKSAAEGISTVQAKAQVPSRKRADKTKSKQKDDDPEIAAKASAYGVNTNLEQISDWLTKIIVGVSLTQIGSIHEKFSLLAGSFGAAFPGGETKANVTVSALLMAYGLIGGFISSYLIVRIYLPGAFTRAGIINRQRKQIVALKSQQAADKRALEDAAAIQGAIYNNLYRYKERGFDTVIRDINQLFEKDPRHRQNPALWTWLAAGYGQAYQWQSEHGRNPEELTRNRDLALNAVKQALESGDEWKPILQLMWDKRHPVKRKEKWAEKEDDLEVFYNDDAFKDLLGSPVTRRRR